MKKSLLLCFVGLLGANLGGCIHTEPKVFGVPQSTWVHLSEAERQAAIYGYNEQRRLEIEGQNQRQYAKEANAPLNSLITVLGNSLENQQDKAAYKNQRHASDFPEMPQLPALPIPPTLPEMPSSQFAPGDCKEFCENRGGVMYCEKRCERHEKTTSTSLSLF